MKYRAFLSYSHADSEFAARFHKDLERWRAGRGLVGRETERGQVPQDLRPIFRDRDDFAGGGTLAQATNEALEASDFLILLCSPSAARSAYVNEEVRAFKALGGSDRIIPVIIDGEPGHPERECFPPALVHKVGPDGELFEEIEDRLAADARSQGDGPRRALAKVISGLLGVPFDEIVRRAELAQRRRNQLYASVAVAMTVLAVLAGVFGWLAETRRVVAERNYQAAVSAADSLLSEIGEELIRTEGIALDTTKRLLGRAESIYDELIETMPDANEVKFSKVAALGVFARAYYAKGDISAARSAAERGEAMTRALVASGPDPTSNVPLAMMRAERAKLMVSAGDFDGAMQVLDEALNVLINKQAAAQLDDEAARYIVGVGVQLALLRGMRGDPDGADVVLARVDAITAGRQDDDAHAINWSDLRATVLSTKAVIEDKRGNMAQARRLAADALERLRKQVKARPDFAQGRTFLAQTLRLAGDLAARDGEPEVAQAFIDEADVLIRQTAAADQENRTARSTAAGRGVAQAVERINAGEVAAGIEQLRKHLADLMSANGAVPTNAMKVDEVRLALRTAAEAFNRAKYHAEALEASRNLLALEQADVQGLDDGDTRSYLAYALGQAAQAAEGLKDLQQALEFSERALEIERTLAEADPTRRAVLVEAEWRSALLLWRLSRREDAQTRYARLVALFAQLAMENPDETYYGSSLTWTCVNLGELTALNGKVDEAVDVFKGCLANGERMLAADPANRTLKLNMAWAEARMALVADERSRWQRVVALLSAADAETPLEDLEEELLTVARISATR